MIGPELGPHAFCYLDDVIVITETFQEHSKWLEAVLDKIAQANLTISPEKCKFWCSEVKYLGYVVNIYGLSVNLDKKEPILTFPAAKNIKQLRCFIGLASWYRWFIPEVAVVAELSVRLFRFNVEWHWSEEQQQASNWLKEALTSAPILAFPNFKHILANPFHLQTDASNTDASYWPKTIQVVPGAIRVRLRNYSPQRSAPSRHRCLFKGHRGWRDTDLIRL